MRKAHHEFQMKSPGHFYTAHSLNPCMNMFKLKEGIINFTCELIDSNYLVKTEKYTSLLIYFTFMATFSTHGYVHFGSNKT